MLRIVPPLLVALFAVAHPASSQLLPVADSLRGIGPVNVEVAGLIPRRADADTTDAQSAFIDWGRLVVSDVVQRLRDRGIPLHNDAHAILHVSVRGAVSQEVADGYAVRVDVSVTQVATLSNGVVTMSKTWERGDVDLVVGEQALVEATQETALGLVEEFSRDYLAVNR